MLYRLETATDSEVSWMRQNALANLHAAKVSQFVESSGFGVGRMVRNVEPTDRVLMPDPRDDAPPQPDYFQPATLDSHSAIDTKPPATPALGTLHEGGILDFVNPRGFGYVKDCRHVAGFQAHGFSKVPGPVEKWEVARLELVGLLMHASPVVYESAKLPRMEELKEAPTRALDAFESRALSALRDGADLHLDDTRASLRFLGAIRSTRQCLECHGGARGDLLGAFSYHLRPVR
jgi:hypothetical protein